MTLFALSCRFAQEDLVALDFVHLILNDVIKSLAFGRQKGKQKFYSLALLFHVGRQLQLSDINQVFPFYWNGNTTHNSITTAGTLEHNLTS